MRTKENAPLSDKQKQVLHFISVFQSSHGYPPTVREICDNIGLTSTSTVHGYITRLEKKGYIRRDPSKPRALEILKGLEDENPEFFAPDAFPECNEIETATIPVVGKVAAGSPILAVENIEDRFVLPLSFVGGDSSNVFVLTIKGESMINAGILNGDQIIVRKQSYASNGEIVVALIDDSATCKRYFREDNFIRLQPENDNMAPIYVKDASILGKVIGVFRKLI